MMQSKIMLGFIIFLGFAGGYLYYSQNSEVIVDTGAHVISPDLQSFENFKFDFSVLDDERYKSLQVFGEVPVSPGITGKRNIFQPI